MKIKFKEIFRKIKYWLSSLSKWAKEHKKTLLTVFMLPLVLCITLGKCSKDKTTASASVLTGSNAFIVTPNISINCNIGGNFYTCNVMPFYITFRDNSNVYTVSVPRATTSYSGLVYRDVYLVRNADNTYQYLHNQDLVFNAYESASNRSKFIDISLDFFIISYSNYDYIVANGAYCTVVTDIVNSRLTYQYFDINDNALLVLQIDGIPYYSSQDNTLDRYSAFNIILGSDINDINDVAVNNAYNDGYNNGYLIGLSTSFEDISPFDILANGVDSFLSTNLFGNFSLSDLFAIAGGILLFMFCMKMFLGG